MVTRGCHNSVALVTPLTDTELGTVAPPCWRRVSASPLVIRYPLTFACLLQHLRRSGRPPLREPRAAEIARLQVPFRRVGERARAVAREELGRRQLARSGVD